MAISGDEADHYGVLGLTPDATDEEIKQARKKLQREFHPDRTGSSDEISKAINEAADTLLNKDTREKYDADWQSASNNYGFWAAYRSRRSRAPRSRPIPVPDRIDFGVLAPGTYGADPTTVFVYAEGSYPYDAKLVPEQGTFWTSDIAAPDTDDPSQERVVFRLFIRPSIPREAADRPYSERLAIDFDGTRTELHISTRVVSVPELELHVRELGLTVEIEVNVVPVTGVTVTYDWGDGHRTSTSSHSYEKGGEYVIRVTATNEVDTDQKVHLAQLVDPEILSVIDNKRAAVTALAAESDRSYGPWIAFLVLVLLPCVALPYIHQSRVIDLIAKIAKLPAAILLAYIVVGIGSKLMHKRMLSKLNSELFSLESAMPEHWQRNRRLAPESSYKNINEVTRGLLVASLLSIAYVSGPFLVMGLLLYVIDGGQQPSGINAVWQGIVSISCFFWLLSSLAVIPMIWEDVFDKRTS